MVLIFHDNTASLWWPHLPELEQGPRRLAQPREEMDFGVARAEPRLSGFIF